MARGRARLISLSSVRRDSKRDNMSSVDLFATPGSHEDLMYIFLLHCSCLIEPAKKYRNRVSRLNRSNERSNTSFLGLSSCIQNLRPRPSRQPKSNGLAEDTSGGWRSW